ncbi:18927_t:CDS:2 [Funneliformis geosporum]|uniref:9029_t:CDS:1 n=1 Tax=Funneliformis geosporum TaxID=1117311 RepID=A0A9W4WSA0_9GLOM|nr:9029_t:CDS:2 [Funneliformis geosporum]CAI2179797.1 18927_t:CDS:2 [Funneliformis geosporum]
MQFIKEEKKSGWLTKLGGNALRKTWKRRWFELRGSYLYYYRQQTDKEPSGMINLSSFNSICQDTSATKKSQYCIRIEKVVRECDSIHSNLSYRESSSKKSTLFLAFADNEGEMQDWITVLEKRLSGRNIVDIVLDRLELTGMHRRQCSYGSLNSFYSKNSNFSSGGSTSGSALSSGRPSLDSFSLDTPSLDSRKSSMDSFHSAQISSVNIANTTSHSRPDTPSSLVERLGIGQPILRKPASHSCLQDRRNYSGSDNGHNHSNHVRKLSLSLKEFPNRAPLIMVHGENSKFTSSPDVVYFPGNNNGLKNYNIKKTEGDEFGGNQNPSSSVTPTANVFPSHLTDQK